MPGALSCLTGRPLAATGPHPVGQRQPRSPWRGGSATGATDGALGPLDPTEPLSREASSRLDTLLSSPSPLFIRPSKASFVSKRFALDIFFKLEPGKKRLISIYH